MRPAFRASIVKEALKNIIVAQSASVCKVQTDVRALLPLEAVGGRNFKLHVRVEWTEVPTALAVINCRVLLAKVGSRNCLSRREWR